MRKALGVLGLMVILTGGASSEPASPKASDPAAAFAAIVTQAEAGEFSGVSIYYVHWMVVTAVQIKPPQLVSWGCRTDIGHDAPRWRDVVALLKAPVSAVRAAEEAYDIRLGLVFHAANNEDQKIFLPGASQAWPEAKLENGYINDAAAYVPVKFSNDALLLIEGSKCADIEWWMKPR